MSNKKLKWCVVGVVVAFFSCSIKKMAAGTTAEIIKDSSALIEKYDDPYIVRDALPSNILLIEGLLSYNPNDRDLLVILAQSYCSYAFAFVEDEDIQRASKLYLKGIKFAERALMLNEDFAELSAENFEDAVATLTEEDIPSAFWFGTCMGYWINADKRDLVRIAEAYKVRAIFEWLATVNPGFYFGGPNLFLGSYYSSIPSLMGGGPEKGYKYFKMIFDDEKNKNFLLAKVIFAQYFVTLKYGEGCARYYEEYYGVPATSEITITQEELADLQICEGLFKKILNEVLESDTEKISEELPGSNLANELAKIKAKKLLEKIGDYF